MLNASKACFSPCFETKQTPQVAGDNTGEANLPINSPPVHQLPPETRTNRPGAAAAQHRLLNDFQASRKPSPSQSQNATDTIPAKAPVIQQPPVLQKGKDIFLPVGKKDLFIQHENGHFYPVPRRNVWGYQQTRKSGLVFTEDGLKNLKDRYDEINGAPVFINQLLKFDHSSMDFKNLMKHPECFPYFKEEKFLVTPNISYDPQFEAGDNPKAQKLKNAGIALNAWFIHPNLSSMNEESRQLLNELSSGNTLGRPLIDRLRADVGNLPADQVVAPTSEGNQRDTKTIGDLKRGGEYLASILDLNENHIPVLTSLKEKTLAHLKEQYKVDENDNVALYFHFPYNEDTVTLHLHMRVNQGFHPLEQGLSMTLDEVISGLSSGKNIHELILEKQNENGGKFYKFIPESEKTFDNLPGLEIQKDSINTHRLASDTSNSTKVYSRDDLATFKKFSRVSE